MNDLFNIPTFNAFVVILLTLVAAFFVRALRKAASRNEKDSPNTEILFFIENLLFSSCLMPFILGVITLGHRDPWGMLVYVMLFAIFCIYSVSSLGTYLLFRISVFRKLRTEELVTLTSLLGSVPALVVCLFVNPGAGSIGIGILLFVVFLLQNTIVFYRVANRFGSTTLPQLSEGNSKPPPACNNPPPDSVTGASVVTHVGVFFLTTVVFIVIGLLAAALDIFLVAGIVCYAVGVLIFHCIRHQRAKKLHKTATQPIIPTPK